MANLHDRIGALALVDHHVHTYLAGPIDRAAFELGLTESSGPAAPRTSAFDSQVGFAVRRHCAPLLGLPNHASADDYWEARVDLGDRRVAQTLLRSSGVTVSLLDDGVVGGFPQPATAPVLVSAADFAATSGHDVHRIMRLESIAERLAATSTGVDAFLDGLDQEFALAHRAAVGFKSIVAYRYGLDFDPREPSRMDVARAVRSWLARGPGPTGAWRLDDVVVMRSLLWRAVRTGLPVQLHVGYGDADLDLSRCNPLLLTSWLRLLPADSSAIMMLHCYPFHREAGYLAQIFPQVHFDVGLAINFTGAGAQRVVAESLELAPFSKILFSTDAWGLPELHLLGSLLWRTATAVVFGEFVARGEWDAEDAVRVAGLIGHGNANRVYSLSPQE